MTPTPRDYQEENLDRIRSSIRSGARNVLYVLPTGGGKTTVACQIIHGAARKGKRVMFLAHRRELVNQCSRSLDEWSVPHGVIMAGHWRYRPSELVQVGSLQTISVRSSQKRAPGARPYVPPPCDIIFIDEAHRAMASSYQKILEIYPQAICVGLTATPIRLDGQGLGDLFHTMVLGPTAEQLTSWGWLVPTRVFAPSHPDMDGVRIRGGDYDKKALQIAADKAKLVGDIVNHWLRLADNRKTIVFAAGVEHSLHLRDRFRAAGVEAEHLEAGTPAKERDIIENRLGSGSLRVVCNCGILCEGFDCPPVSCTVLARPTMSLGLYLQMAGRILRPLPGKADALILDHAGCTLEHGFVTEPRAWSLYVEKKRRKKEEDDEEHTAVTMCRRCYFVYPSELGPVCPECGFVTPKKVRKIENVDGQLVEITGAYKIKKLSAIPWLAELQRIAETNAYKPGWVWHKRKEIEGLPASERLAAAREIGEQLAGRAARFTATDSISA